MGLYNLFSYNVEIQYKGCLLSKAMLFTTITTLLNLVLPFFVAYRSKGFWLNSYHYYEQPAVQSTYNYLLVAETDDPSIHVICGDAAALNKDVLTNEEYCAETQIQEYDINTDNKNDLLEFRFHVNIPHGRIVTSIILMLEVDFQLKTTCPLHMKSLAVINREFSMPPSGYQYYGDIKLSQAAHLPCHRDIIHSKYNNSLFSYLGNDKENFVDFMMKKYFQRETTTEVKTTFSRSSIGHASFLTLNIYLRVPEIKVHYTPNLLQELKWAWPQYFSLAVIFYWFFEKLKKIVFNNRLFMAWEVIPWKKKE